MKNKSPIHRHVADWWPAYVAVALLYYGIAAQRWLVAVAVASLLVAIAGFAVLLVLRERRLPGPDYTILSTPPLKDAASARACDILSSLGLAVHRPRRLPVPATELDLLVGVELPLDGGIPATQLHQQLTSLGVALPSLDQPIWRRSPVCGPDILPRLNRCIDSAFGQLYYTADEDPLRILFLSRNQVAALAARGWLFQPASDRARDAA